MTPAQMISHYVTLDRALVAKGFPATSPYWLALIRRFYESGRRQAVLRIGRRGGKSSTLARLAVCEALYGGHAIPPGDVGVAAFVSVSRDEASQRLRTIRAILDAVGIAYHPIDGGVELDGRPIAFKVFAASIAGVSGFTSIFVACDEVSKWRDNETGANPASEVLASLRPTMATQRYARMVLSSSPLGSDDAHAEAFAAGETDYQIVAHAETWVANPTITEAETHQLEPEERVWRREYAAQPGDAVGAVWNEALVAPCFQPLGFPVVAHSYPLVVSDPSGLAGRDRWTAAQVQWVERRFTDQEMYEYVPRRRPDLSIVPNEFVQKRDENGALVLKPLPEKGKPILLVSRLGSWSSPWTSGATGDGICACLAGVAGEIGASRVVVDQWSSEMVKNAIESYGVPCKVFRHDNASKADGVAWITRHLREKRIKIIDAANPGNVASFRSEMLSFKEKLGNGLARYEAQAGRHDDWVSLLLLAARAMNEGLFAEGGNMRITPHGKQSGAVRETPNTISDRLGGQTPAQSAGLH